MNVMSDKSPQSIIFLAYIVDENVYEVKTSRLPLSLPLFAFSPGSPIPIKTSVEHQILRNSKHRDLNLDIV